MVCRSRNEHEETLYQDNNQHMCTAWRYNLLLGELKNKTKMEELNNSAPETTIIEAGEPQITEPTNPASLQFIDDLDDEDLQDGVEYLFRVSSVCYISLSNSSSSSVLKISGMFGMTTIISARFLPMTGSLLSLC